MENSPYNSGSYRTCSNAYSYLMACMHDNTDCSEHSQWRNSHNRNIALISTKKASLCYRGDAFTFSSTKNDHYSRFRSNSCDGDFNCL